MTHVGPSIIIATIASALAIAPSAGAVPIQAECPEGYVFRFRNYQGECVPAPPRPPTLKERIEELLQGF